MLEVNQIYNVDALSGLRLLDSNSVHCCICSPPYFGLRKYLDDLDPNKHLEIGLENSLQEYIGKLVEVFAEVYRVLRMDGSFWLNLGDSYANTPCGSFNGGGKEFRGRDMTGISKSGDKNKLLTSGLKQKDLMGVPWRVAFALQDFGWYLRSDIIWAKGISFNDKYSGSCMPESCKDRPTKSHEYLFLLTKSPRYYYDRFAIEEKSTMTPQNRFTKRLDNPNVKGHQQPIHRRPEGSTGGGNRNLRSVWTINPKPYKGVHFATFPPKLIEPCIKIGTSEHGCCASCGQPYTRIIEKGKPDEEHKKLCGADSNGEYLGQATKDYVGANAQDPSAVKARILAGLKEKKTIGWQKQCRCETDKISRPIILDPFMGSGTVAVVAKQFNCDYIGFELNPEYVELAYRRINGDSFLDFSEKFTILSS